MARFNARTTEQIFDAAHQGTQFDPALMGKLDPKCRRFQELRQQMTDAYVQGRKDRQEREPLYDAATIQKEQRNAIAAYELATTEPAISYTIGYASPGAIPVKPA